MLQPWEVDCASEGVSYHSLHIVHLHCIYMLPLHCLLFLLLNIFMTMFV